VSVGDVIDIDLVDAPGAKLDLEPVMLVDGSKVVVDKAQLGKAKVSAKVIGPTKGPKIHILKFKNKSGQLKRQGHRQKYTRVEITGIKLTEAKGD